MWNTIQSNCNVSSLTLSLVTQVAQLCCDVLVKWSQWRCLANEIKSMTLDVWVTLKLNFRLKGYILRQYLWTVRWRNGYTTTVLLKVFTQRNFVADFIRLKLNVI